MISIITSVSFDDYFFKKKKIIYFAVKDLIENLKKFKIKSELIIVSNSKKIEKYFNKIKSTNIIEIKFFVLKNSYSQMKCYSLGLKKSVYKVILFRDIDLFFNNSIYEFLKKKSFNSIYYIRRFDLKSNNLKNYDFKKKFLYYGDVDNSINFYYANLQTRNVGCFMIFRKKDIVKVGLPCEDLHADSLINYSMNLDLGLKQEFIKDAKIYKFTSNQQFDDRLKKKELSFFQKRIESFFYRLGLKSKQINIIRGVFNYPKVIVMFPKYYNLYGGKYLDSNERFFFRIFIKNIFPFFKLYKKIN
jgi:hypothetical protein